MTSTVFKGVVHGKTIELDQEPGLPDGQTVTVSVQPLVSPATSPTSPEAQAALRRAAGAWAKDAEDLDKFLDWNRERRKLQRREIADCGLGIADCGLRICNSIRNPQSAIRN